MVKETIYCDRCGNECENVRFHDVFMYRYSKYVLQRPNYKYVDLCQKCVDELDKWMKEYKK